MPEDFHRSHCVATWQPNIANAKRRKRNTYFCKKIAEFFQFCHD